MLVIVPWVFPQIPSWHWSNRFGTVKTVPYGSAYGSFIYFQTSANLISPERRKRAAVHHHYSLFSILF